jgi:hypothetical protein
MRAQYIISPPEVVLQLPDLRVGRVLVQSRAGSVKKRGQFVWHKGLLNILHHEKRDSEVMRQTHAKYKLYSLW